MSDQASHSQEPRQPAGSSADAQEETQASAGAKTPSRVGRREGIASYANWRAKDLRAEVSKRRIRRMSNAPKAQMVAALEDYDAVRGILDGAAKGPTPGPPRPVGRPPRVSGITKKRMLTENCAFRLLNVIFSSEMTLRPQNQNTVSCSS